MTKRRHHISGAVRTFIGLAALLFAALLSASPHAQDTGSRSQVETFNAGTFDFEDLFAAPDTRLSDDTAANAEPDGVSGPPDCAPHDRACQERVELFTRTPDLEDPGLLGLLEGAPDFDGPDALAEAGLSLPDVALCEQGREAITQPRETRTEYRCEAGMAVEENTRTCSLQLVHAVDERYTYACEVRRNPDGTLSVSEACERLETAPGCSRTDSDCVERAGPIYSAERCREGPAEVTRSHDCRSERIHQLALSHLYECRFTRDAITGRLEPDAGCTALHGAGCTAGDRSCTAWSEPGRETRHCEVGQISRTAPATCRVALEPVVESRPVYRVGRDWNENLARFEDDAALRAVRAAGCALGGESCVQTAVPRTRTLVCEQGERVSAATGTCRLDLHHGIDTRYIYRVAQWQDRTGWRQPAQFDGVVAQCRPGPRACTAWEERCAFGDGFCDGRDRWASPDRHNHHSRGDLFGRGDCLIWETTYTCDAVIPGAGAPSETLRSVGTRSWSDTTCPPLPGGGAGCTVTESCASGRATRTVDGLRVTEDCWSKTRAWSCPASQSIDTCGSRPSGAQERSRRCTDRDTHGTCRLWSVTWAWEEPDGSGGCHRFEHDATCPGPVAGLSPARWVDTLGGTVEDRTDCAAVEAAHSTCRWTRSRCTAFEPDDLWQGEGSTPGRLDRDCWAWELSGTCETLSPAPACTADVSNCTRTNRACEARGLDGTCRLYRDSYDCPRPSTERCISERHVFQCDRIVPEAGIPIETTARAIGSNWSAPVCASPGTDPTADPACREVARHCTEPGQGHPEPVRRTRDPALSQYASQTLVEEACWAQTVTYACEARSDRPACRADPACTVADARCLMEDATGACLLREVDRRCEAPQCAPRQRVCDERASEPRQSGHKYLCETLETSQGGPDRYAHSTCGGLSRCHRVLLEQEVEHFTVDRVVADPEETGQGRWRDEIGFLRRSRYAHYCPTPVAAAEAATYVGHIAREGGDAETADCAALDANPRCVAVSETCVTGRRRSLDSSGRAAAEVCAGARRILYDCEGRAPLSETQGGAACSGDCLRREDRYVCDGPVPGAGEPLDVTRTVVARIEGPECEALEEDETCALESERCVEGPATRPVGSGTVTAECWAWERDYICSREVGRFDNCEPEPHCTFREAQCLAQSDAGDCLTEERVYDCVTREDIVLDEGAPATCEDLEDPDGGATDGGSASRTLPDALAALQSAGAGAEDYRTSPEMFGGDPLKCSKLLLGTKNCCKRTGLLIGLGCGESSNRLRDARDNDRCIPLGAYCSKKALFGACLKKKETDCCYKSSLARIVIETAIRQTGLDLGSAKRPRCDGLSVTQFQLLDLSRADFSSVADDILSDMSVESAGDASERLRRSIEAMQGQGTSGLPDDPAPWTPPSPPLPGG